MSHERLISRQRVRIITEDGSVTAYVVWGLNHILQKRQFAWDEQRWFYQPTTREKFIQVNSHDLPDNVVKIMAESTNKDVQ